MKRTTKFLLTACILAGGITTAAAQEVTTLHESADAFLKTHFQSQAIHELDIDPNDRDMYDVELADGTELEFDRNGELLKMESDSGLPLTALPLGMGAYINANYPDVNAVEFEKERNGFEIELSNGSELKFDTQGKFLRIDR